MTQNISELAKALRDAADAIEKKARFTLVEQIDLAQAVGFLEQIKPKDAEVKLTMTITLPYGKITTEDPVTVEFNIDEGYKTRAKSESFAKCIEAYAVSREGKDSMASVARLVKTACKIEGEPAPSLDTPEVSA